jgi:hypothetical protein
MNTLQGVVLSVELNKDGSHMLVVDTLVKWAQTTYMARTHEPFAIGDNVVLHGEFVRDLPRIINNKFTVSMTFYAKE